MAAEFDLRGNRANQPKPQPVPGGDGMRFDLSGGKAKATSKPINEKDIPIPVPREQMPETYQGGVDGKVTFLKHAEDAVTNKGTYHDEEGFFTPDIDITDKRAMQQRVQQENQVQSVRPAPRPSVPNPNNDSEFVSLDAIKKDGRTPIIPGTPPPMTAPRPTTVKVKGDEAEVDTPAPIRVINNLMGGTPNADELTDFDISSLPKRKPQLSQAEDEQMAELEKAVDRECKSISERIHNLTEKQYDELMEARASGTAISHPLTEEEMEAEEARRVAGIAQKLEEEEGVTTTASDTDENGVKRRIVIRGEGDEDEVPEVTNTPMENFIQKCNDVVGYVTTKVTATNYFDRVFHGRNALNKRGIVGEIWAIVMYNGEGEAVAHPILVAKKDGITAAVEVNLENIAGVHIFDDNDTVESIYRGFQSSGSLYEYIDYLKRSVVIKLPLDMPTAETALKLANDKLGENTNMKEEILNLNGKPADPAPVEEPDELDLDAALNPEEASAFNEMTNGTVDDRNGITITPEQYEDLPDVELKDDDVSGPIPEEDELPDEAEPGIQEQPANLPPVVGQEDKPQEKSSYPDAKDIIVNDVTMKDGKRVVIVIDQGTDTKLVIDLQTFKHVYGDPFDYMPSDSVAEEEPEEKDDEGVIDHDTPTGAPTSTPAEETIEDEPEEDPLVIKKEYEGGVANETAKVDELQRDLERELRVTTDDRTDDQIIGEIGKVIRKTMPSIKKRISLKDFKISDTPISASQVAGFSVRDVNQADWVVPNAARVISTRGLSGPELFSMNPQNIKKNKINTFRQIYGIIYKHIISKKPPTFDEWLKVTRFSDIDHIYAALIRSTFPNDFFLHYECPDCNNVFIQDFNFDELVKYRDDKAEKRIKSILNSGDTSIPGYDVELSQISDQYVVGLKDPSIWNMVMETAALSDDFLEKYEDLLDTMSFIDSIYIIDAKSQELRPIDFGYDPKNPAKSTARKITIMSDIIRTLSSDNYFDLRTQIAKMFTTSNDVTYQIPEATCPKCGHKFEAEDIAAMQLLFMRHQLGALGAM